MRKLKKEELARLCIEEFKASEKTPFIVVLDNVRSMNNIGSVFRTSDAFRIEAIFLCGITATPPHKDIYKTALGASESVKWKYYKSTIEAIQNLKSEGYIIISVEQVEHSILLSDFEIKEREKYAIVLGNEVKGVLQEVVDISDYCVEIPQFGTKHSFNISVCCGIVLWDFFNKNHKTIK
ncbi:RNA methyltransferase [Bacteroidota bacterium]